VETSERLLLTAGLLLLGTIFIGLGIYRWHKTQRFNRAAQRTSGTIIALKEVSDPDGRYDYPVVRFVSAQGAMIEFEGKVNLVGGAGHIGRSVEVLYNPHKPEEAQIKSFYQQHMVSTVLIGVGALFALVALLNGIAAMWETFL
jgi:hypothetical protein